MTIKRARQIIKRNKHAFGMIDDDFGDAIIVLFEASKKLDDIENIINYDMNQCGMSKSDALEKINEILNSKNAKTTGGR